MKAQDLMPIEKIGDYWFKREDLYIPYDFSSVNGSKLRQCQLLVDKNADIAKNGLITGTSVLSPQAVIVSAIAKANGYPCTILYGGTTMERLIEKEYPKQCIELGANVQITSKGAFNSVLQSKAIAKAKEEQLFPILYGMDLIENIDVFVDSVANQVENIPNNIKNIVVTVGSSITLLGILLGISKFNKNIERIYGIGCAPNRLDKIKHYADLISKETNISIDLSKLTYVDAFNELKGYKYENIIHEEYNGIIFHPRYEAKTFKWLRNNQIEGDTLMWITGSDI